MAWWSGIFQNVLSQALWVLGSIIVGLVVALLRKRGSLWVTPVLSGLGAFLLMLGVMVILRVLATLTPAHPPTTTNNVEQNIKEWSDHLGYSIKTVSNDNDVFALQATGLRGRIINIERPKAHDQYIVVNAQDTFSDNDRKVFDRKTQLEKALLAQGLTLELARTGVLFTQALQQSNLLSVEVHVPITDMTEDIFGRQINSVDDALLAANAFLALQFLPGLEKK